LTYPLLYGPGTTDVVVNSMAIDASENVLIGGQSKFIQTNGEGFLMLVDKYGEAVMTETIATGADEGDSVLKVALQGDGTTFTVVGTSTVSGMPNQNAHFILTLDSTGSAGVVDYFLIGDLPIYVSSDASINDMYMQGTFAHIIYSEAVAEIVDLSGSGARNSSIYIVGDSAASTILKVVAHPGNIKYTVFAQQISNKGLDIYYADRADETNNNKVTQGSNNFFSNKTNVRTVDFNVRSAPTKAWVACAGSGGTSNTIFASHHSFDETGVVTYDHGVNLVVDSTPLSIHIMYVSETSFYVTAKLGDDQGTIYLVTDADTVAPGVVSKQMIANVSETWFVGETIDSVVVTVGTIIGAEDSGATSPQAIIFKSNLELDFSAYNCYEISDATGASVSQNLYTLPNPNPSSDGRIQDGQSQTSNGSPPLDNSTIFEKRVASLSGDTCGIVCPGSSTATDTPVADTPVAETQAANNSSPSYLDSGAGDASSRGGVGTSVAVATSAAIGASVVSGAAPVITGSVIGQCQAAQMFSLFNMNRPKDYDEFSQSFAATKLDGKFIDFMKIQDSSEEGTRRNLASTGYKDLSNVRLDSGSFLVNYIYLLLIVVLLGVFHVVIILLSKLNCIKKREEDDKIKKTLMAIRKAFEFGVYFYITMTASLFVWLCVINEIAAGNFGSGFDALSFFVSVIVLMSLFGVMLFPVLMVLLRHKAKRDGNDFQLHEKTFFGKIWANYRYGLKETILAELFYATLQLKFFCYSIIFILVDGKEAQIVLFILVTIVYCGYYAVVRPFNYLIQNIVVTLNECFTLLIAFMFCGFLKDGDPNEDLATAIIVLFTINIVIGFVLGLGFQLYLLIVKCKENRKEDKELASKHLRRPTEADMKEQEVCGTGRQMEEQNYNDEMN
jgi:hypothetical protein